MKIYHEQQSQYRCAVHSVNNLLQEPHFSSSDFDRIAKRQSPGSWFFTNPHKSAFGGNYDANVLVSALGEANMEVHWQSLGALRQMKELEEDIDESVRCHCGCRETLKDQLEHSREMLKNMKDGGTSDISDKVLRLLFQIDWSRAHGAILNTRGSGGMFGAERHWLALTKLPGKQDIASMTEEERLGVEPVWYNLDSKLSHPSRVACVPVTLWRLSYAQPESNVLVVTDMGEKDIIPWRK